MLSKSRFLLLCAAPAVILGIIPFIVWYILADYIAMPYSLAIVFTAWVMTIMAIGDYANIYNAVRQVPKGAKVMTYRAAVFIHESGRSLKFWHREPPKMAILSL